MRVLLASFIPTHFVELVRLARALRAADGFEAVVAFGGNYAEAAENARQCAREGIEVLGGDPGSPAVGAVHTEASAQPSAVRALLNRSLASVPLWIRREKRETRRAGRVLDDARADVLVLAEDNVAYPTANWIAAAHRRKMSVAILPYTVAGASEFAESLMGNSANDFRGPANRIAGAVFPRWVHAHRDRKLVLLPGARVFAKEITGLAPAAPWVLHSGNADVIAVESERMMRHYRSEGLPPGQLRLTGSLADDALAEVLANKRERKAELARSLGLDAERPLLLCALPPDQFVFYGAQSGYDTYDRMIERWMAGLAEVRGWSVVVCPHPRERGRRLPLPGSGNVRLAEQDTASLVPLCDLFLASVSATIRWAIACGTPCLNFDVYKLRYRDYDDAPGVVRAETADEYSALLRRLTQEEPYLASLATGQRTVANEWGKLDGQSGARILSLLGSLGRDRAAGRVA